MRDWLNRLFGGSPHPDATHADSAPTNTTAPPKERAAPPIPPTVSTSAQSSVTSRYFELSDHIEKAKQHGDYKIAIAAARETFPLLKPFVAETVREYGRWDIALSHAVHTASTLMAVEEDDTAIAELRQALEAVPKLRSWLPVADQAEADCAMIKRLKPVILEHPGLLQNAIKKYVNVPDARRISTLLHYLERGGHIRRLRTGSTYMLYPADAVADTPPSTNPATAAPLPVALMDTIPPSWSNRSPRQADELNLQGLPIVRLPAAPPTWEARKDPGGNNAPNMTVPKGHAFVAKGTGWAVTEERKLTPPERPDAAFRLSYPGRRWTYLLDPRGRSVRWPQHPSVLRVTDETGHTTQEQGLPRDCYHASTNRDGSLIVALSQDGVLHSYTHTLEPRFAAPIQHLPEYRACARRFELADEDLRRYVRCVAVSDDGDAYLVSVIDEAWCLSPTGEVRWGVRFPTKEEWAPVQAPTGFGTTAEIMRALQLLGVSLPATQGDIANAYRQRAMEWHPDRHPGDPMAVRRMQDLNAAVALLRAADDSKLLSQGALRVMYEEVATRHTVTVPGGITVTTSLQVGPLYAADWIYAAAFGDGRVYLAGYSGRVVEVTINGQPVRAYDIGAVPYQITRTSRYLYLLTTTRLYVLEDDRLVTLFDVFGEGRVIPADAGFGLLEKKHFRWFSPTGELLGAIEGKDPIRRIGWTASGVVVESGQHRGVVTGPAAW